MYELQSSGIGYHMADLVEKRPGIGPSRFRWENRQSRKFERRKPNLGCDRLNNKGRHQVTNQINSCRGSVSSISSTQPSDLLLRKADIALIIPYTAVKRPTRSGRVANLWCNVIGQAYSSPGWCTSTNTCSFPIMPYGISSSKHYLSSFRYGSTELHLLLGVFINVRPKISP